MLSTRSEAISRTLTSNFDTTTFNCTSKRTVNTQGSILGNKTICSVFISKSVSPVVGICFVLADIGVVLSTEINDSLTLTRTVNKIQIYNPNEILVESLSNKLVNIIQSNIDCKITRINKKFFNNDLELIKKSSINPERDIELKDYYFGLCATTGAINHMKEKYPNFNKFRIKYEPCEATMFIDKKTIRSLELVENLVDQGHGISLFKFLNSTVTKMGERVLRNNILQPLTDAESIKLRLESVKELISNTSTLAALRELMKNFQDTDKLFNLLVSVKTSTNNDQKINTVILLKQAVEISIKISKLLETTSSSLLFEIKNICKHGDILKIQDLINEYINEDCSWALTTLDLRNQKCYAVKSGRNGLLDVSRQLYHNIIDDIIAMVDSLSEEFELDLDYKFDSTRGFYMRIKYFQGDLNELPEVFINKISKKGKFIECTTLNLIKSNSRLNSTLQEIILMSDQIIEGLLNEVGNYISTMFMLSEAIAILDLLCCFAYNADNSSNYVCPEIVDEEMKMVVKQSRHPILEKNLVTNKFISNDIILLYDTSRLQILTGANMSGKSVYLKQIALLSIMAQIGSLVPADYALLPIFENLHARICNDNFEVNTSTFSAEMGEISYILKEINSKSLLIIDELGRGSSLSDGFSISLAITESLIPVGCSCFMSTHFTDIPKILATSPGVVHLHFKSELDYNQNELIMYHKLISTNNFEVNTSIAEGYGILMVQKILPSIIIQDAKIISKNLKKRKNNDEERFREKLVVLKKQRSMLDLVQVLKISKAKNQLDLSTLKLIQEQFIENFKKLNEDNYAEGFSSSQVVEEVEEVVEEEDIYNDENDELEKY
ncbi:hypothetical protein PACTADRAFT_3293 [Pachysolen tannophilus NRRL Y-2460]|uniref:DNA mismatch repair proteins mutS family domain-containing protein n=1 Tax=Pachysolen tannophilus NRRL Y-2460 TaxID=669874 RepID=A0A1E4TV07_PACTA|nr:hypothetical protein PACTADRAFT_3293 [Pachysolen tannophilus NRRL Y-2460]